MFPYFYLLHEALYGVPRGVPQESQGKPCAWLIEMPELSTFQ